MKNHSLINFIVFVCALVAGYTFSNGMYLLNTTIQPVSRLKAPEAQNSLEAVITGQRNFLVITTTSISGSNPRLVSIWLASYFAPDTNLQLMPIYPSRNRSDTDFIQQLNNTFRITQDHGKLALSLAFIQELKNKNYSWNGYAVIDDNSLITIIDLLGGIELNGHVFSGNQVVKEFSLALDDPHLASSAQMAVMQSVCKKISTTSINPGLSQLFSLISDKIITDLDLSQTQAEFQSFVSREPGLSCNIPMLQVSKIVP
jgi:anionic cell wall polymer biosynthesis LytR-Cps2A-Psr (LCP) family protein